MENENEDGNEDGLQNKKGVAVFGNTSEPSVGITSKYANERPCRVHGVGGVRAFLEANAVTAIYTDQQIARFLEARNGALFDDGVRHFINALNKFRNETAQGKTQKQSAQELIQQAREKLESQWGKGNN